jgi:hypothetical protein
VSKGTRKENDLKVLATAGLILSDTLVFHEVLARSNSKIKTLAQIKPSTNVKKTLEEEWNSILKIDYIPVFKLALNILENLPASAALESQLHSLIAVAYDIAASPALLRHDLMGRLYHQLLLGKLVKYFATLYTSLPAARLLARLVVNLPSEFKFDQVPPTGEKEALRTVDFACGSGTLLSAVYKEIDAKHRVESSQPDPNSLHQFLVEQGLWGFDVLLHAAHLTALTLFLHNPNSPVSESKVFVLPMGIVGKPEVAHLGSLDFLTFSKITPESRLNGGSFGPQKVSVSSMKSGQEELPIFGICIMNPPFTRSVGGNLLFGSLPREERRKLQKELAHVLKSRNLSGIGQAGLGGSFTFLANQYLKKGGRLGLVLPKGVLSGVSWSQIRELLLEDYYLEYVVSSFEGPDDWNFSENTHLSEVLLVARKAKKEHDNEHTLFVNLWKKPRSEIESIFVGSLLLDLYSNSKLYDIENSNASPYHLRLRGKKIGEVYSARIESTNFGQYQFFGQAELNRVLRLLREGTIYLPDEGIVGRVKLAPLSKFVSSIGPDVKQVHNAYEKSQYRRSSMYCALWNHDSSVLKTMEQMPNASLDPRNKQLAKSAWKGRGKLLIVERAWLATYRILSCLLKKEVLSNVWWPLQPKEVAIRDGNLNGDQVAKILTLWFNSTFGMLLLLSIAEVTRGAWVKFKKEPLLSLPVIDISELTNSDAEKLIDSFEKLRLSELKSLPEEFGRPKTKKGIDDVFKNLLNIEPDFDELYRLLSADPSISAQPLS